MTASAVLIVCFCLFGFLEFQVILLAHLMARMAKRGYEDSLREVQVFAKQQLQEARIAALERRLQESWDSEEAH
jgi:hypothetical protein